MSKLQELLDEKWPIGSDKTIQGRIMNEHNRQIFTEGYNAAIEEALHFGDHLQQNYKPDWQMGRWNHKRSVAGEALSTSDILTQFINQD